MLVSVDGPLSHNHHDDHGGPSYALIELDGWRLREAKCGDCGTCVRVLETQQNFILFGPNILMFCASVLYTVLYSKQHMCVYVLCCTGTEGTHHNMKYGRTLHGVHTDIHAHTLHFFPLSDEKSPSLFSHETAPSSSSSFLSVSPLVSYSRRVPSEGVPFSCRGGDTHRGLPRTSTASLC